MIFISTVASYPESVLALKGNSVTLIMKGNDAMDPHVAIWNFNHSSHIVRYYPHYSKSRQLRVSAPYKGRVEIDSTDFSLKLKNLMKIDNGLYIGEIHGEDGKTVVKYSLSVLGK